MAGKSLRLAVTESDDQHQLFVLAHRVCALDLGVGQPDPAGIQPESLRRQHDFLAVIAAFFAEVGGFSADEDDIISDSRELAVMRHDSVEGLGFVDDELNGETALAVALVHGVAQFRHYVVGYGSVCVFSHAMAYQHCFFERHKSLLVRSKCRAQPLFVRNRRFHYTLVPARTQYGSRPLRGARGGAEF